MDDKKISDFSDQELNEAQNSIMTIISLEHKLGDVINDDDKQQLRNALSDISEELKSRSNEQKQD